MTPGVLSGAEVAPPSISLVEGKVSEKPSIAEVSDLACPWP